MPRTIVIVDDHPAFRRRARQLLEAEGFEVVGDAADGSGAISAASELDPELMLLDVNLPDGTGFEVADRLNSRPGAPDVILTSTRDEPEYARLAKRCGARGFVTKSELSGAAIERLLA